MSRSYKHYPCTKDSGRSKKEDKQLANRKVRHVHDIIDGMMYKRIYESYDICDHKWKECTRADIKYLAYPKKIYNKNGSIKNYDEIIKAYRDKWPCFKHLNALNWKSKIK